MTSPLGTFKEGDRFGPYKIRSLIGINTGEVYRAHDPRYGREVVLCVFSPRLSGVELESKKKDLERQMNLARTLNNPNIPAVYEFGTWEGRLFVARELLEGRGLRDHLQGKSLNVPTSVDYARQIVTALEVAHDAGIVHGCLRPAAIFVTVDNRIKVLDFGLQAASDANNPISIVGDPAYMSPEQLRGADWDRRSDFFAFGSVLYEMLAGVSPFQRNSYLETVHSVLRDNPRPLSEINPRIPRSLTLLVKNCLAKDRGKRPESARTIALELESPS